MSHGKNTPIHTPEHKTGENYIPASNDIAINTSQQATEIVDGNNSLLSAEKIAEIQRSIEDAIEAAQKNPTHTLFDQLLDTLTIAAKAGIDVSNTEQTRNEIYEKIPKLPWEEEQIARDLHYYTKDRQLTPIKIRSEEYTKMFEDNADVIVETLEKLQKQKIYHNVAYYLEAIKDNPSEENMKAYKDALDAAKTNNVDISNIEEEIVKRKIERAKQEKEHKAEDMYDELIQKSKQQ